MNDKHGTNPQLNLPFPSFLAQLAEQKADGVLVVSSRGNHREFRLTSGEVRAARSSAKSERLGSWLVARELLSEDDRALSLLKQDSDTTRPLGELLVERGLVDPETLDHELEELAIEIATQAAAAPAYCEFREGHRDPYPDTIPALTTTQIILTAAREYADMEVKSSEVGPFDQLIIPRQDLEAQVLDLRLTPTEGFLLSRLIGPRTLSSLEAVAALPHDEMVSIVYTLSTAGLVRLAESEALIRVPRTREKPEPEEPSGHEVNEDTLLEGQIRERRHVVARAKDLKHLNHYAALDLAPGAPDSEIDAAWKAVARRYDPLRAGEAHLADLGESLQAIMDRAEEALDILSNPASRGRYDQILSEVEEDSRSLATGNQKARGDDEARTEIVEANFRRADQLIFEGEYYLAIQLLQQACDLDPRPLELVKLTRLMMKNPLWTNRALANLKKAVQVDPSCIDAWLELAEIWRRRDDPERQRKALERALTMDPGHDRANQMYVDLVGEDELTRYLAWVNLRKP